VRREMSVIGRAAYVSRIESGPCKPPPIAPACMRRPERRNMRLDVRSLDGVVVGASRSTRANVGNTQHGAIQMTAQVPENPCGYDLLRNPRLNKGTAFTEAERRACGLEGLLPPAVTTLELQVARRHAEIAALDDDLQKYLVLSDLQARNETLYYAVLMS